MKTSDKPFYAFLSGAGGVGKSHLIKSIYQAALTYYSAKAGDDFHRVHVLLLAPTGKAAYLIKGNTIHSALAIPASQSLKNYRPLDSGRLNTLRCELRPLKLILLDEISMVGNSMFTIQLNNRLKDLKGSKEDFSGASIITLGRATERIRGARGKISYGAPMTSLFKKRLKTGGKYCKVLRISLNGALNTLHSPRY